ncbi:MAG: hypothetical protein MIO92_16875, partial [Methanosarcinaceae archaeon]|nr:hypothetical protein [Methanosarcinaceae archaeon]
VIESTDPSSDAVEELEPIVGDDGLISTVEYQVKAEKEAPVVEDTEDVDISDGAEQKTPEATPEKTEKQDFHEHPRFKELIEEKNELKRKLEEVAQKVEAKPEKPAEETPDYNDIMSMEDDDIIDQVTSDPKGFFSNYAKQLAHEIKTELRTAKKIEAEQNEVATFQERATKTYQDFFDSTPDGQALLDSGSIRDFVNSNPGHNAISAYYALTGDAQVQAKIEAAKKETEARIYKELKSAGKSRSTATQTGGRIINTDKSPEMMNPDKFGGRDKVLLDRLRARQAS